MAELTIDDVFRVYASETTHRSKVRDGYSARRLLSHFGGMRAAEVRRVHVRSYIAARTADGVQLSTVARELRHLSAALNHVRFEHEIDITNPVQRIRIQEPEHRIRWITPDEAADLVKACSEHARRPHVANFVRLALNTGCRRGELLGLEWDRVDFDRCVLRLEAEHTKAGKRRVVPLNEQAIEVLRDQWRWVRQNLGASVPWVFAMTKDTHLTTVQKTFTRACCRARIADLRVHDLRHTFASWLVMSGESLYVVKDLLGHSSITVTERYAHLAPKQGAQAVQRLPSF